MAKRKVEIFTSGCYLCDETVALVKDLACSNCEVAVYDLSNPCESRECIKECIKKSRAYGVTSVPTVVVDGKIVECCKRGKPDKGTLISAGLGKTI